MERREFIGRFAASVLAGGSAVAGATVAAGREQVERIRPLVDERLEALESRVDRMEHHHRNLLRVGAIGLAVSTGIDLTLLL